MENDGIKCLANALKEYFKENERRSEWLDFGVINEDMSLSTNKRIDAISQNNYSVCRSVQWGAENDIFYKTQEPGKKNAGKHLHGNSEDISPEETEDISTEMEHIHDTLIGPKFRWLQPGDRVLVAWINREACVIDIICPATNIGRDADGYEK